MILQLLAIILGLIGVIFKIFPLLIVGSIALYLLDIYGLFKGTLRTIVPHIVIFIIVYIVTRDILFSILSTSIYANCLELPAYIFGAVVALKGRKGEE